MGVWGAGNFEQDGALDFVWSDVQQPLVRQIEKMIVDPECAEPDEPDSSKIMAAVEILALLCEHVNAVPPKPSDVASWRKAYLKVWDDYIDELTPKEDYKAARRRVIVETFDRLAAVSKKWHSKRP